MHLRDIKIFLYNILVIFTVFILQGFKFIFIVINHDYNSTKMHSWKCTMIFYILNAASDHDSINRISFNLKSVTFFVTEKIC